MSIECAECEHDLRGGHAEACSRYEPDPCPRCGRDVDEEGWCPCPVRSDVVRAVDRWPTNAALIDDVNRLHPLGFNVLDATYGRGNWWTEWSPPYFITNDIDPDSPAAYHDDFRQLRWPDDHFDGVAYDPPYKLNGTPALGDFDARYGIDQPATWQDRMALIAAGFRECARVLDAGGVLYAKCQDQVCSGQIRWQTLMLVAEASELGLRLVDRFDLISDGRPQPEGRRQLHGQYRPSTLLIFRS